MATAKKNKEQSTVDILKSKVTNLHDAALQTSNELVEESIAAGEQWQNLLARSLKKGVVLFGRQQEMMLSGLEMMKDQYTYGNKRFRKLITSKPADSRTQKPAPRKAAAKARTTKNIDQVMKATAKAEKTAKPAPAKAKKATKPATVKATPAKKVNLTNLTVIEGIGPKIQELLKKAGIANLNKLAAANPADLKKILTDAGTRYQMHDPSTWAAQAKLAAAGKMDELNVLKAELKGGK